MAKETFGQAMLGAARWTNKAWKKGPAQKAGIVGAALLAPYIVLPFAVAACVGTAQLDKAAAEREKREERQRRSIGYTRRAHSERDVQD